MRTQGVCSSHDEEGDWLDSRPRHNPLAASSQTRQQPDVATAGSGCEVARVVSPVSVCARLTRPRHRFSEACTAIRGARHTTENVPAHAQSREDASCPQHYHPRQPPVKARTRVRDPPAVRGTLTDAVLYFQSGYQCGTRVAVRFQQGNACRLPESVGMQKDGKHDG